MKLHLPSGLRKALMACLAAVAFALPSTLSSASLPAGALISFVLAQQVTGAEETVREGDEEEDELDSLLSEERAGIDGIMPVAEPMPLADTTFPGPGGIVWSEEEENIDSGTHNITEGNAVVTQTSGQVKNLTTSAGTNLKINKDNTGGDFQLNGSSEIHSTNVWVTHKGLAAAQAGTNLGYVYFNGLTLGSEITDFWINGAGINFDNWKVSSVQRGALSANFHIGTAYNTTSGVTPNSNAALFFQRSGFVTSGYLEAVEAATVFFRGDKEGSQGAACIVHFKSLKSAEGAVLTLASNASTADMASTLVLDDSTAVSEYKAEQLNFNSLNIDGAVTVQIADSKELEVKGLSGQYAKFAKGAGEGTATVKLVGKDTGNSIANVIFGENVILELDEGAVQTFTGTSSVSKLTGAGTLNIGMGSVSIAALDGFTGTISAGGLSMKSLQLEGGGITVEASGSESDAIVKIETEQKSKLAFASEPAAGLTLKGNQQLTLSGAGEFAGQLALDLSSLNAVPDGGGEGYITLGTGIGITELKLTISGLKSELMTDGTKIRIFTEESDAALVSAMASSVDYSSLSPSGDLVVSYDNGVISIRVKPNDLVWGNDTGVWTEGDEDANTHPWTKQGEGGSTKYYFRNGDNVIFSGTGAVSISGSVNPWTMTISGNGYTFSDAGTTNAAIIAETLTVTGGTTTGNTINVPITVTGTTTIGGENNTSKLTFGGAATLGTLSGFGEITFNGTTTINAINLTNEQAPTKTLTLKGRGTRTINSITVGKNTSLQLQGADVSFSASTALAGKGTIEVGSTDTGENNRTLTLSAGTYNWTDFEGTLSVHGTLKLNGTVDITTKTQTNGNLVLGTIDLNGGKLWLATGNDAARTITANLKNVATIESKGNTNPYTINGNLTGSESCSSLTIKKTSDGSYLKPVKITGEVSGYNTFTHNAISGDSFSGTVLEFAGKLSLGTSDSTFTIGGNGTMAVTGSLEGSGKITLEGGGLLKLGGTLSASGELEAKRGVVELLDTASFSSVTLSDTGEGNHVGALRLTNSAEDQATAKTVNKISIAGTGTVTTRAVTVEGNWTVKELALASGKTLTFEAKTGEGVKAAQVSFGDGATAAKVGEGTLQLSGGAYSGRLEVTINKGAGESGATGGQITLGNGVTSLRDLTISLNATEWLNNLNLLSEYQLFTGQGVTDELLAGVKLDDSINNTLQEKGFRLQLNSQGKLTVSHAAGVVLTWSSPGGTWADKDENTKWKRDGLVEDYFANGDEVKFTTSESGFESGGAVTVAGTVNSGKITVDGGTWTYSGTEAAVQLSGDLALENSAAANFSGVSFALTGKTSEGGAKYVISGEGTVTFEAIQGDDAGITIGDGSTSTTVHFTDKKVDTTMRHFGAVEVKGSSKLVIDFIQGYDAWGNKANASSVGGDYVYGDGTVVLRGEGGTASYPGQYSIVKRLFASAAEDAVLDTLELENATLNLSGNKVGLNGVLERHLRKFVVKEGSTLQLDSNNAGFTSKDGTLNNTLYLAGSGVSAKSGALTVIDAKDSEDGSSAVSIGWDIVLSDDATIQTGSGSLDLTGTLDLSDDEGNGHTLTKTEIEGEELGLHTLNIGTIVGVSDSDKDKAGSIVIKKGKLNITGLKEAENTYVAKSVTVTADETVKKDSGRVAEFVAGTSFTVGTVVFTGDPSDAGPECITNAVVSVADGATLTIGELDLTASNGTITGSSSVTDSVGTIVIEGFKTGSGHSLRVGWAGEHVKVTLGKANGTFDLDGGLYLANGNTVTLASNGRIGWLGGNTNASNLTSGWNDDIGGTITAGSAVTLTLDGTGKTAGKYTINENVKLLINNSSAQQTFISSTIHGDIQIENGKTLAFEEAKDGDANVIEGESKLSGDGTLRVQNSKVKNRNTVALTWSGQGSSGFTGMLEFAPSAAGVASGTAILQLKNDTLSVGGIVMAGNGELTKGEEGSAKLTVNGVGEESLGSPDWDWGSGALTVGSGVTLEKAGTGTQFFSSLTGEADSTISVKAGMLQVDKLAAPSVEVTGGTLQIAAGMGTWSVDNLKVSGSTASLDIARAQLNATDTNITLTGGGKITDSVGDANANFQLGTLTLEGASAGSIEWGESGVPRLYEFKALAGNGSMALSGMDGGSTGRTIILDSINGFTGEITGSVNDNCKLQLGARGIAEITSGGADTEGKITLSKENAVTLSGADTVLKKVGGDGAFTISELKLDGGQGLFMGYTGGALNITNLSFTNQKESPRLVYDDTMVGNTDNRVEFSIEKLLPALRGLSMAVELDTGNINPDNLTDEQSSLYLGITGTADIVAQEGYSDLDLAQYFSWDEDAPELEWKDYNGQKGLYLSLLSHSDSKRYWDGAWDDGAGDKDGQKGKGPNNKIVSAHAAYWYDKDNPDNGLWNTYAAPGSKNDTLQLARKDELVDGSWMDLNGRISLRLEKGSAEEDTKLTIIGGKLYNDLTSADTLTAPVYLSTRATEKDHFHMLVGGSSFREVGSGDAGGYAGDTHLQVMGGTIDFLIGGNHMSAGGATFGVNKEDPTKGGNTYISVYEGQAQIDGNGDFVKREDSDWYEPARDENENLVDGRSVILGGIVGGSTLTDAAKTGNQFNGSSHIYIYTVLTTPSVEGMKDIMPGVSFSHIVGGNVWLTPDGGGTPTFVGSSTITIDLTGYQGVYEQSGQDYTFDKAIVGGNYSASDGTSSGVARSSVFKYGDTEGSTRSHIMDNGHSFASHITVKGTNEGGEAVTFRGGINGATRVDANVRENATYEGSAMVEIEGGAFQNYIAGGFWFDGINYRMENGHITPPENAVYTGTFTGTTEVHLNGGEYWRAVGGHVSLTAAEGSGTTHELKGGQETATKLVIDGGTFRSKETGLFTGDEDLEGFVAGGSYYRHSLGTYSQTGASELEIKGGSFGSEELGDYKLVGGNVVKLETVDKGGADVSYTITGDTKVTISEGASIKGLVIGGGYMEDEKADGSLTITGSTNVTIKGGTISAKTTDFNSTTGSDRLAIVAGSMLVDTGTSGGHTLKIGGGTNLTINDGTINGYVVGGSYSSSTSDGTEGNSIILGESINVNLNGGTIVGNVFGGHYSDNTDLPSSLALGNVKITLAGTDLEGYIFGGSYRRAQKAADTTPTQGAIEIELKSGSVAGGVYAAGNHLLVGKDANLRERTASTKIVLTGDVTIKDSTFQQQAGSQIILSGGYQRGLKSDMGGTDGYTTDYSTVGYNEESKSWNENAAVLEFSNKGESDDFSSLQGLRANLYLQDLDTIDVNEGLDVKLEYAHMRVMHKVTKDAGGNLVQGEDTFTKGGEGNLTLGTLWSWHAQETGRPEDGAYGGKQEAYTGKIILGGGTLTLTGGGNTAYEQSLEGGLMINMYGRSSGNADQAYLKGENGTRFTGLDPNKPITLQLAAREFELGGKITGFKLSAGVYYLVDGLDLDGIDKDTDIDEYIRSCFHVEDPDADDSDSIFDKNLGNELYVRFEDERYKLVLRIFNQDTKEWYWEGGPDTGAGIRWTANSTENFTKEGLDDASTRIYYFNAGAAYGEGEGKHIELVGNIEAKRVIVESGDYTFRLNSGNGLDVGTIQVGIDASDPTPLEFRNSAELTLEMKTSGVDEVVLNPLGTLTLSNTAAIQSRTADKEGTRIVFNGGTLAYGEDNAGALVLRTDYSRQVDYAKSTGNPVRIRVGNEDGTVVNDSVNSVTWKGSSDANAGIKLAVEEGIVKSGRLNFTLETSDKSFAGTLEAEGGTLTLKASNGDATIKGDDRNSHLTAAEGATVELIASGAGSSLTVARAASGEGTIAIGSGSIPEEDQGSYVLSKEVSTDFTGTIRLAGNAAEKSVVTVNDVKALGRVAEVGTEEEEEQDRGSTLTLAGRAITLGTGVTTEANTVNVQKITVEGTNYVGGYDGNPDDANKTITLSAAGGITGGENAVLANAKGGYAQTLEGDLSEYKGAIVAGHATSKGSGESTWTLEGELKDGSATIAAKLAGSGQIIVKYDDDEDPVEGTKTVRLTGLIGDANMGTHVDIVNGMGADSAVVLANTNVTSAAGSLIFHDNEIWLGDELGGGTWSGSTLALDDEAESGTFRLKNGRLLGAAGITEEGKDAKVKLIVDTAQGGATVDVGKTKGSLFDEININAGGELSGVTGDITVGEGKTGMHLIFTKDNIGPNKGVIFTEDNIDASKGCKYLIDSTGKLIVNNTVEDNKKTGGKDICFSFDLTNDALFGALKSTRQQQVKDLLEGRRAEDKPTYLHLLTSNYKPGKDDNFNLISFVNHSDKALNELLRSGKYTGLLEGVGFTMSVDGGDLVLLGSSLDIYIVLRTEEQDKYGQGDNAWDDETNKWSDTGVIATNADARLLSGKKATLLDTGAHLEIQLDDVRADAEKKGEEAVDVTVNNLVGLSGSTLDAQGEGTVTLNNAKALRYNEQEKKDEEYDPMEDDQWLNKAIGGQAPLDELKGQDTEFEGTIKGGEKVTFLKKGAGTLTVGNGTSTSGLQIEGTLTLTNGSIVVRGGDQSELGTLVFDYEEIEVKDKDGNLQKVQPTVGSGLGVKGGTIYVDHIVESEDAVPAGKVTLSDNGVFVYKGTMTDEEGAEGDKPLVSTTFTTEEGSKGTLEVGTDTENATLILGSKDEGEGKPATAASIGGGVNIVVNNGSTLKLQDRATMEAGQVELTGTLDMSELDANPDETNTASALSGEGTLKGSELTQLTIDGQPGTVDGQPTSAKKTFSGTLEGAGTLSVAKDAAVYFDGLSTKAPEEGGNKWDLDIESGATLDVKLEKDRTADLGNVTLHDDSNFVFHCNTATRKEVYEYEGFAGALKVEGEEDARANLTVDLNGWAPGDNETGASDNYQTDYKIKLGGLTWDEETNGSKSIADRFKDPKIAGRGAQYFSGSIITGPGNVVFVELDHEEQNMYKHANQEKNAAAGADIFWGIDDPTTDAGKHLDEDGDLYEFTYALGTKYQTSGAGSELDRMLTAGAGASIAVLGQALGDDLHRQLNSLRNRTTGMGSEARYDQYDMLPLYHMWVNGETGYHKLDADGLAPGYTLNSWGGTLGMEIDVSRRVTVGLALTAMYGDLKTDATDSASGDMDTTYMSAFVRGTHGAWSHTLVVTGGMADVKFNRTVGYDAPTIFGITMPASYKTSGSTDGYMVGAIYELGYTRMANAAGTVAIQPVFNVEIRHVGIQGYNETGSDAGLRVGDITQDTVTIGLGARMQALTGTNIFNRSAIFEGRALLKADVGDRSGKVVNAVLNTQNSAELESAEVGAVGVEIGAGISIPLGGTEGSIFIDGSLEWRSGYTSMDATIGYRVNF